MKRFQLGLVGVFLFAMAGCSSSSGEAETASMSLDSMAYETAAEGDYANRAAPSMAADSGAGLSVLLENRHVIRTATMEVQVDNVEEADTAAQKLVQGAGGFVSSASTYGLGSSSPSVNMTVRVPVAKFEGVLGSFSDLGILQSKSMETDDVTGQMVDMDARLKTLRAKEEVFVGMLRRASSTTDLVEMENQLSQVRGDIERIAAQRKSLAGQAQYSTIELTLAQGATLAVPEKDKEWTSAAWTSSTSALGGVVRTIGTMLIWILTFLPVWLPVVVVAGVAYWRFKRGVVAAG